ncbi:MFS transporter [Alkaliphilus peptidifermentans]|uniref:Major Facilitator Superfamily protein n=1 Tax=Alkaliphilus peptidifermentans DSM 18978 TaxID=1120976 RepID=A0A1G5L841_9FIRM|nr:MFS transporter [Alkaliphilus peptidifermentans]SCZ08440.1 Major Facilitator Superfamily protein [Alkaliphilus peptidifermentans DSM 18978]
MNMALFKNKNFSLFVFGQATSIFGDIFLNIALSLYVLNLTGSAEQFAAILALGVIPQILLGPFAGTIVDRLDKKKTIIFLDIIRCIYLLVLLLVTRGELQLNTIYITVLFFSLCDIFFGPSFITIFPLIMKKEELVDGNALKNTVMEGTRIAAPVLGAFIFGRYGLMIVIFVDALTYLISALSELFMKLPLLQKNSEAGRFMDEVWDGFKVFLKDIRITSLVANGILSHVFLFPFFLVGFPYLLIQIFAVSEVAYGTVQSIMPVGFILSVGLVSLTKNKLNQAESINFAIVGMLLSVLFVGLLIIPSFVALLKTSSLLTVIFFSFINFIMFLSFGYYGVYFVSFYQSNIPNQLLGRFGSILIMLFAAGRFIGFKIYGYLFNQEVFLYPIAVLAIGMILKLIVHIPFMIKERKIQDISNDLVKDI